MSGLKNITYQTIVDAVKTYIKNNSANIANFAGIPAAFKSGYSSIITISGGNAAATCYCTVSISGNAVTQATTTNVDNDMSSFLQTIGATSLLSQNIKSSELIKFVNDITIFCANRLYIASSIYNSGTNYLIYSPYQSGSYSDVETVSTGSVDKQIDYTDATSIVNAIVNTTKQVIRCIPIQYSENYS